MPIPCFYQEAPAAAPLTLAEAIRQTLERHPALAAARRETEMTRSVRKLAEVRPAPNLTLAPWLGSPNGTTEEFFLSLMLEPRSLRSARKQSADAGIQESEARLALEVRKLAGEVALAYARLLHARARRALNAEVLALAKESEALAARQVELGARAGIEKTQLAIETTRLAARLRQSESDEEAARLGLNAAMALPPETPAPALLQPLETLIFSSVASAAPALTLEKASADRLRAESERVRAEGRPTVSVALRSQNVFRSLRPSDRGAMVSVSFPLSRAAQREKEKISAAQLAVQSARILSREAELLAEREQALLRLRSAEDTLKTYDSALLSDAKKLLDASQSGFRLGQTALPALLEARRTYAAVTGERLDALFALAATRIELARIEGDLLP